MYGILKYDHSDERLGVVFFSNDAVGFLNRWKLQLIMNLWTKSLLKKSVDKIKAEKPFYWDYGAVDIGSGNLILSISSA